MKASAAIAHEGFGLRQACDKDSGEESSETYVKRVVGLPGDHLKIVGGKVFRDGVEERGSYLQSCDTGPSYCHFPRTSRSRAATTT